MRAALATSSTSWKMPGGLSGPALSFLLLMMSGSLRFALSLPWPSSLLGRPLALARPLNHLPLGRAPGLDGWHTEELRAAPDPWVALLARFFTLVETHGRWPRTLAEPEGLLLPKGGTASPLDRRPIWLFSLLYRAWGRARAQELGSWLHGFGAAPALGALDAAFDLSSQAEFARAHDLSFQGFALDWSKAYDHVTLVSLRAALGAARVPQALAGPMLDAYSAERRIRVNGLLGAPFTPTSGLPAGCPLAVFALALLLVPWRASAQAAAPSFAHRLYVDDVSLWKIGGPLQASSDELVAALGTTGAFARLGTGPEHPLRHACLLAVRPFEPTLAPRVGPFQVGSDFLDLGIPTRAGPISRFVGMGATRLGEARLRLNLIGRLPLPWAARGHLSSSSALAGAGYGLACGLAPLAELRALRARTIHATWGHALFHANPAALMALASPSWRWDPFARAAIEPLLALHRALQLGTADLPSFARVALLVAGGSETGGPASAILHGLRFLGLGLTEVFPGDLFGLPRSTGTPSHRAR